MRKCERNNPNNPEDTKVSEGGGRSAPSTRAEVLLQHVERTTAEQAVSLQLIVYYFIADTHSAAHGEVHSRAAGSGLTEAVAHGEPRQEPTENLHMCRMWAGDAVWRGHSGTWSLAESFHPWGNPAEKPTPEGWIPWYGPTL